MINKNHLTNVATLFALALFSAAALGADEYAPRPIAKNERCVVCGMYPANYPKWHSQIVFKDGEHSSFDSPIEMFRFVHNMAKYDKRHSNADIGKIFVPDYEKGGWIDAKLAYFVSGSDAKGPMGNDLPAFASKEAAAGFSKKAGGEVFSFQQVTPAVVNGGHGH